MKFSKSAIFAAAALTAAQASPAEAANYAWPEKFEGVMLQGFYWDSYTGTDNTKWTTLTANASELSSYFKVIWVPNSAKAASNPGMGYDPVYWFSNHNSSFGTEAQLRTMISTFKGLGTDIIEDVVINHRSGVSNWTNFPAETWNGVTYQLGPEHICSTDEVAYA
ncbi:MAG: alpha-amylase, partial [Muribaculaceae bacterium]|nr:alpha-amylase [Muribaculaceae bacterium]